MHFGNNKLIKLLCLLLVAVLCLGPAAAAADTFSLTVEQLYAYADASIGETKAKTLLNGADPVPQSTGWKEYDAKLADILKSVSDEDAYTQLLYAYNYIIENVSLSYEGYAEGFENTSKNAVGKFLWNYTGGATGSEISRSPLLTYIGGDTKTIPDKIIDRSWHALLTGKGASYDYAALFCVMARYIGIDAYMHAGRFTDETDGSEIYHGWAVLQIDGTNYIFDPERDDVALVSGAISGKTRYYFCVPNTYFRYLTSNSEKNANVSRDAGFLSTKKTYTVTIKVVGNGAASGSGTYRNGDTAKLTAKAEGNALFDGWYDAGGRLLSENETYSCPISTAEGNMTLIARFISAVTIQAVASRSGSASGSGEYDIGDSVTLTAFSSLALFTGWYDADGNLVSNNASMEVQATSSTTYYALFQGDVFADIPADAWYLSYAIEAAESGLVKGRTEVTFNGDETITRAEVAALLTRLAGGDESAKANKNAADKLFVDVSADAWYSGAIGWAAGKGIVNGNGDGTFAPNSNITREQFFAMIVRFLEKQKGLTLEKTNLTSFTDTADISSWALAEIKKIDSVYVEGEKLVNGRDGGKLAPQANLTRAEAVRVLVVISRL